MDVLWGLVIVALGLFAWIGQVISWFAPTTAVRLGLAEAQASVEPAFWADARGEAVWDAFTLWTLPLAGVLLIAGSEAWAWLGLVGGGMYVYFGGRGVLARLALRRRDLRIGDPAGLPLALTMLVVWGLTGLLTAVAAATSLA